MLFIITIHNVVQGAKLSKQIRNRTEEDILIKTIQKLTKKRNQLQGESNKAVVFTLLTDGWVLPFAHRWVGAAMMIGCFQ